MHAGHQQLVKVVSWSCWVATVWPRPGYDRTDDQYDPAGNINHDRTDSGQRIRLTVLYPDRMVVGQASPSFSTNAMSQKCRDRDHNRRDDEVQADNPWVQIGPDGYATDNSLCGNNQEQDD